MNEKSSEIRVLIENADKRLSAWFDFPITPQELNDKIGVPVEKFNDYHPSYKVKAVELPNNITFDELNKLVKGSSSLAVEIVNIVTDKKDTQYVPVDVKKLAEHTGCAPNPGCYKINKAFITIDTIDEMNKAFSPANAAKVNEISNKSDNEHQKLKKGFVLSRKDIKMNAQTIAHNKPEQQNKNRSHGQEL